jgi:hypothetical protein
MKGFQNIFFYDLFVIWIRFPFMFFMGSNCGYVFLMVLGLFFFDLFMALKWFWPKTRFWGPWWFCGGKRLLGKGNSSKID